MGRGDPYHRVNPSARVFFVWSVVVFWSCRALCGVVLVSGCVLVWWPVFLFSGLTRGFSDSVSKSDTRPTPRLIVVGGLSQAKRSGVCVGG